MGVLSSVVSALSTFYPDSNDPHDPEQVQLSIIRLMAKLPTIAAYSYKRSIGQPFLYPNNSLDLIENFLTMMFAVPSEPYEVSPTVVHAMKELLILHADHEQNCSTSTVRLVGSSDANLFASVAAGINALWGPLHGGANQAVIEMLEQIRDDGGDIDEVRREGEGPRRLVPALGLRPPRLQELRPARPHHQGTRPTRCSASSARPTSCSTSRSSSRTSRSPTSTSSSASCTRTSTSTRASSTGRWASPPTCSRCCSRWAGCPGWIAHWKEMMERPEDEDRPPAPDLHRPDRAHVRPDRPARLTCRSRPRRPWTSPPTRRRGRAPRRGARVAARATCRGSTARGSRRASTTSPRRSRSGREWQAQARRGPVGRRGLARGVRRAGRRAGRALHRHRGAGPGARAGARRPHRHQPRRPDAARPRHRRAEAALAARRSSPAERAVVPAVQRARRRQRPRRRCRRAPTRVDGGWRAQRPEGVDELRAVRRLGPVPRPHQPRRARSSTGISVLVVDMRAPGVEVRPLRQITDEAEFNEVFFADVFVPDDQLVGPENEGWRVAELDAHPRAGHQPPPARHPRPARSRSCCGSRSSAARSTTTASRQRLAAGLRRGAAVPAAQLAHALAARERARRPGPRAARSSCTGAR